VTPVNEAWTQADIQDYISGKPVKRKPMKQPPTQMKAAQRQRGTMNKGEAKYAEELQRRLKDGEIKWFEFEAVKVRLADNTFCTIDFAVIAADGFLELHDVKGRKGDGYWCEEDAKIKLKVVAERFPARVKIVWPNKSGVWMEEVL
jgi:hypothetical protein